MIDLDLEKLDKEALINNWQRHRMWCLEQAMKLNPLHAEQVIEMADALSGYILRPIPAPTTSAAASKSPEREGS
jgi:hypothetical protein